MDGDLAVLEGRRHSNDREPSVWHFFAYALARWHFPGMGFPLMVRAMRLPFESIDRRLEQAAGTLGANRMWTFCLVSLPLALPGIIAGAILAFARALGEFGATITFVANIPGETQTISSAIYSYTPIPDGDANAMRLTIVSIAISFGALVASEMVQRRTGKILANRE